MTRARYLFFFVLPQCFFGGMAWHDIRLIATKYEAVTSLKIVDVVATIFRPRHRTFGIGGDTGHGSLYQIQIFPLFHPLSGIFQRNGKSIFEWYLIQIWWHFCFNVVSTFSCDKLGDLVFNPLHFHMWPLGFLCICVVTSLKIAEVFRLVDGELTHF